MIIISTHNVSGISEPTRFVDYTIGLFPGFETRSAVKKGIKKNRFLINGDSADSGTWMKIGDRIDLLERTDKPKAYGKEIEVVYEDDYLAIVNKPAGIVVSGNQFKTLENCLVDQLGTSKEVDALDWALPIHRLDAPTSGLVIFAKTRSTRRKLGEMLERKTIAKNYHAIVHGVPENQIISQKIDGREAESQLTVIKTVRSLLNDRLTLVQLEPVSGRTHQLRIHCHEIGHSIVGDQQYMNPNGTFRNKGLFLAATSVKFNHPITLETITVSIPTPNKFNSLIVREERRSERY